MKFNRIFPFILFVALAANAMAQAEARKAAAVPALPCPTQQRVALPIACWVGQKIMILLTEYDTYNSFGKTLDNLSSGDGLNAKEYVGRIGTIKSILKDYRNDPVAEIVMDDNKEVIYAGTMLYRIPDVAFVRDFEDARQNLIGKEFWIRLGSLPLLGKKDVNGRSIYVEIPRFTKVTVSDIAYSDDMLNYNHPIKVIVKLPDGRLAYDVVSWGDTNVLTTPFTSEKFENDFLSKSPKEAFHFPDNWWDAINKYQVIVGMDAEAVKLAWNREPDEILKPKSTEKLPTVGSVTVDELWVYWGGYGIKYYIYFKDGKVVFVEHPTMQ